MNKLNKFKMILLFIILVVLIDFAWENITIPPPELKLFTFTLGKLAVFLLVYISLALGLVIGWLGHTLRIRKKRRQAAAALTQEKQAQESQQGQEAAG